MAVGLSTYCFRWRFQDSTAAPLALPRMIEQIRELGASALQICDYEPVEHLTKKELRDVRSIAETHNVVLELGTRGVDAATMSRYLSIAQALHAPLVRTTYAKFGQTVPLDVFERDLSAAGEHLGHSRVKLSLETYEMIPTRVLVQILQRIANPWLGICLDPGNSLAALETPHDVMSMATPLVSNVHVKDFAYARRGDGCGFEVTGRRLGEGQLDYRGMLNAIDWPRRNVNAILEGWLPWQGSLDATCEVEADWAEHGTRLLLDYESAVRTPVARERKCR